MPDKLLTEALDCFTPEEMITVIERENELYVRNRKTASHRVRKKKSLWRRFWNWFFDNYYFVITF